MIVNHQKEKISNAITYFFNETSLYGKKKLYKLLFILDFEHYKQTGRSVTGVDYFAWRMGPVPTALDEAIDNSYDEIVDDFEIEIKEGKNNFKTVFLIPKKEFDAKFFSKRELRLLKEIATKFSMSTGDDMVWFTHRESEPWYRVWEIEKRRFDKIPYEYALEDLEDDDKNTILNIAQEREAFFNNYK